MKKKYDLIIGIGGNINSKEGLHPIEVGKKAIKKLKSYQFIFKKYLVGIYQIQYLKVINLNFSIVLLLETLF